MHSDAVYAENSPAVSAFLGYCDANFACFAISSHSSVKI